MRSPYDGSSVGRVPKGDASVARRAVDAAERALAEPLPAHERAAILERTARLVEERADEVARTISAEAGKPMKAARVEAARAASTFTMAAVEARKLAGDVVPMDASPAGVGEDRAHAQVADRRRRSHLPVQLPLQPRRSQDRAGPRRGLCGRAEARIADAVLRAAARGARGRRRGFRPAGSTSSAETPPRSAMSSSTTSASRSSPSRAQPRSAGRSASERRASASTSSSATRPR